MPSLPPANQTASLLQSTSVDICGINSVSGFYGPGAWLSWILILVSCIIDRIFAEELPRPNSRAHMFGVDLNLISACTYPLVAAANILLYIHEIWNGKVQLDHVGSIASPLLVLRFYYTYGSLLMLVWVYRVKKYRYNTPTRLFRITFSADAVDAFCIYAILWFAEMAKLSAVNTATPLRPCGPLAWGQVPTRLVYCGSSIFLLLFVCRHVVEMSLTARVTFAAITITWLVSLIVESLVDVRCWRTLLAELLPESDVESLPMEMLALYAVFSLPSRGYLINSTQVALRADIGTYLLELITIRSKNFDCRVPSGHKWHIVEQNLWHIWQRRPEIGKYESIWADVSALQELFSMIVLLPSIAPILWSIVRSPINRFTRFRLPRLWPFKTPPWLIFFGFTILYGNQVHGPAVLGSIVFRSGVTLFQPQMFKPVTDSTWTDLDQLAAVALNGVVPLLISLWTAGPNIRDAVLSVFGQTSPVAEVRNKVEPIANSTAEDMDVAENSHALNSC